MKQGIFNYSEIGKLNKVLVHRIGNEVEGLVPENFERLLFDDIPFLKVAKEEHNQFSGVLEEAGVEVLHLTVVLADVLADESVKKAFLKDFLRASNITSEGVSEALTEYLLGLDTHEMVKTLIKGVKKEDIPNIEAKTLSDFITSSYPFYLDPLPNAYFTRDPAACIGQGVSINRMSTQTRYREALFMKYAFGHSDALGGIDAPRYYDIDGPVSLEGGDVHILNKDTVALGLSERTSAMGIETLAKKLLGDGGFKKILVFDIPKLRAYMHLDTIFTMVDYDKFAVHHDVADMPKKYTITLDSKGEPEFKTVTDSLADMLKKELGLPAVKLIQCGGGDYLAAQREQWGDAANVLAIAPGKVVTYARNTITNALLDKEGIEVLAVHGSELSRGRGGTRCMCMPICRDEI